MRSSDLRNDFLLQMQSVVCLNLHGRAGGVSRTKEPFKAARPAGQPGSCPNWVPPTVKTNLFKGRLLWCYRTSAREGAQVPACSLSNPPHKGAHTGSETEKSLTGLPSSQACKEMRFNCIKGLFSMGFQSCESRVPSEGSFPACQHSCALRREGDGAPPGGPEAHFHSSRIQPPLCGPGLPRTAAAAGEQSTIHPRGGLPPGCSQPQMGWPRPADPGAQPGQARTGPDSGGRLWPGRPQLLSQQAGP